VRLWNIADKSLISELHFGVAVTRIAYVSLELGKEGITIYVGFADGCMRVLVCISRFLVLKQLLKPHTSAVHDIQISSMTNSVATTVRFSFSRSRPI
jgi:hypothetical protein